MTARHAHDPKRATAETRAVRLWITDELAFRSYGALVGRSFWDLHPQHTAPVPKSVPTDPPSVAAFLDGTP